MCGGPEAAGGDMGPQRKLGGGGGLQLFILPEVSSLGKSGFSAPPNGGSPGYFCLGEELLGRGELERSKAKYFFLTFRRQRRLCPSSYLKPEER